MKSLPTGNPYPQSPHPDAPRYEVHGAPYTPHYKTARTCSRGGNTEALSRQGSKQGAGLDAVISRVFSQFGPCELNHFVDYKRDRMGADLLVSLLLDGGKPRDIAVEAPPACGLG